MPQKVYLDENGNQITGTSRYLDDSGEPVKTATVPSTPAKPASRLGTMGGIVDQTVEAVAGVGDAALAIPQTVGTLTKAATGGPKAQVELLKGLPGMITGALDSIFTPIKNTIRGGAEYAIGSLPERAQPMARVAVGMVSPQAAYSPLPTDEEWARTAGQAGSNLGGLAMSAAMPAKVPTKTPQQILQDKLKPTRTQIKDLSDVISPGVQRGAPQEVAIPFQQALRRATEELGIDPMKTALKERAPKTDLHGDLYRGLSLKDHVQLSRNLGKSVDDTLPYAIERAERAVEITDRPMRHAVEASRGVEFPQVKQAVVDQLSAEAKAVSSDPALSRALTARAQEVAKSKGTSEFFDEIKARANKKTRGLFSKSPSAESAASANTVYADRVLADSVREHWYPALEAHLGLEKDMLIKVGRIESAAIQGRDGIMANWAKAASTAAPEELIKYLKYVLVGDGSSFIQPSMTTQAAAAGRRFLSAKNPLVDFNRKLRDGIGPIDTSKLYNPKTRPLLAKGSTPMGSTPDPSKVTATKGTYGREQLQLPKRTSIDLGAGPDPSGVTAVPAEFGKRQFLIPERTSTTVTQPPVESMREMLRRQAGPNSRIRRSQLGSGEYSSSANPSRFSDRPSTFTEYAETRGGAKPQIGKIVSKGQAQALAKKLGVSMETVKRILSTVGSRVRD